MRLIFSPLCLILTHFPSVAGNDPSPQLIYGRRGGNVTLLPNYTGDFDEILWRHNNNKVLEFSNDGDVKEFGQFRGRTEVDRRSGRLTVTHLRTEDAGQYKVEVTVNSILEITTYYMEIMDAVTSPMVTCKKNGSVILLHCSGKGTQVQYQWEGPDFPSSTWTTEPVMLEISPKQSDNSTYVCVIKNQVSHERSSAFSVARCEGAPQSPVRTGGIIAGIIAAIITVIITALVVVIIFKRCRSRNGTEDCENDAQKEGLLKKSAHYDASTTPEGPAKDEGSDQPPNCVPEKTGGEVQELVSVFNKLGQESKAAAQKETIQKKAGVNPGGIAGGENLSEVENENKGPQNNGAGDRRHGEVFQTDRETKASEARTIGGKSKNRASKDRVGVREGEITKEQETLQDRQETEGTGDTREGTMGDKGGARHTTEEDKAGDTTGGKSTHTGEPGDGTGETIIDTGGAGDGTGGTRRNKGEAGDSTGKTSEDKGGPGGTTEETSRGVQGEEDLTGGTSGDKGVGDSREKSSEDIGGPGDTTEERNKYKGGPGDTTEETSRDVQGEGDLTGGTSGDKGVGDSREKSSEDIGGPGDTTEERNKYKGGPGDTTEETSRDVQGEGDLTGGTSGDKGVGDSREKSSEDKGGPGATTEETSRDVQGEGDLTGGTNGDKEGTGNAEKHTDTEEQ